MQMLCQCIGAHPHGFEEVFPQDLSGMNRAHAILEHITPLCHLCGREQMSSTFVERTMSCLVIVHDLDIANPRLSPNKTDSPLIVDTNTVLSHAISS